ncbi:MAG: translocation/assembly module TamB domain-containing protein [Vicinamibacterales bacterium]
MRTLALTLLALLVLVASVVIGVHLSPVRSLVLRSVLPLAEGRANLRVQVGRLDYNLFRLTATVSDVKVAAARTPEVPFFEADRVSVTAPPGVLRGLFALTRIEISGGRVRIVRTAEGSNLPTSSSTSTTEPGALQLGHVSGDLDVDVRDDVAQFSAVVPRLSLDLSPSGGHLVAANGQLRFRGQPIAVSGMAGSASFDGRTLALSGMYLSSDVASLRVDGPLTVITRAPRMELRIDGGGDVARLTAFVTPTRVFEGRVTFEGTLAGPFTTPVTDMQVRSGRLSRDMLSLADVSLTTRVTTTAADVSQATFGLAGGQVQANAHVSFDGSGSRVDGTWDRVDVPRLISSFVARPPSVLPAGATSGTVVSEGQGFDLAAWNTDAAIRVAATGNAPQRLALPGQSELRIRSRSWQLDGAHRAADVAPVEFRLSGRIQRDGRVPLAGLADVAMTDVAALASALTRVGLVDLPPSLLTAGSLTATAMVGGELESPTLEGTTSLEGVKGLQFTLGATRVAFTARPFDAEVDLIADADAADVGGQPLRDVHALLTIRGSAVDVSSLVATEAGGSGTLTASGRYQLDTQAYELQSQVANWLLASTTTAPVKGTLNLTFAGAGTVARPSGEVRATVADAFYSDLPLGGVTAEATLDGDQARFTFGVPQLSVQGRGLTGVRAPYATVLDVDVQALDLARLQPLVKGRAFALRGNAAGTAHAEGNLTSWQDADASLDLTAAEAYLGELAVALDGPAQVFYRSRNVGTVRLGVRAGGVQADVRGSLPIERVAGSDAAMTLSVIGDVGDLLNAMGLTGLVDLPPVTGTGPVAVMARVEGAITEPELTADIDVGPALLNMSDLPPLERVRILGHVEQGRADIQDLSIFVEGAQVSATASAPLSWASSAFPVPPGTSQVATLNAQIKNITASLLGRLATGAAVPDLEGSLDATLQFSAASPALADVTGEARIERLDVRSGNLAVTQAMPTRIVADRGVARIESWEWSGEGTSLSVSGQVRLSDLETSIMANGQLDLRLLSPFVRGSGLSTAGTVIPRLSVTGPLRRPNLDGDVVLTDADLRLASPRVFVSDLNGRAVFERDNLRIESMTGVINGGDLIVQGNLPLRGGPLSATLAATIRGMALQYPDGLRTEIDSQLTFHVGEEGEVLEGIPVVQGAVQIVNGSYREPITVVGGVLAALQARANTVPSPVVPNAGSGLALNLIVTSTDDIIVDNNAATAQLDVDLRVTGTVTQPVLSGRAEVREGGRVLLGRNTYEVTSGALYFANPNRIDPELNLDLTTRAGGVSIDVMLTGTASAPKVALSDANGELAQSDLTSLLLTGRTLDQLGSADAEVVGTVLVGNLSGEVGQVLGLAGRVVGIDTIRLGGIEDTGLRRDPTAIATDTDPTTRLTFTKSIGANVDVTFSQSLREGDQQTWVVEYAPSRRLLARLISNDQDLRSYEFRHDVLFGSNSLERATPRVRREPGRVSEVNITGELPGQDVRTMLNLEPGKRFDFEALQDDRDRLEDFYRTQGYLTARVGARQTTTGDMVAVSFSIQPGPRTRIEVRGMAVTKGMTDAVARVWADSLAGPLLIDDARSLVSNQLAQQGYFRATVEVELAEIDGVQVLTIAAEPGPRTTEIEIALTGVPDDVRDQLQDRLSAQKLVQGAPHNPQVVSASLEQGLRELGYLDPRIAIDQPVYEAAKATVNVRVQSGEQVLLGEVTVTGATLEDERVRAALDLTEGLSYLQAAVDNAETRLTSFYRQEGYPSVRVTLQTVPRPAAGTIDVAVTVVEGPRQMIEEVAIDGLRKVAEATVIRAMALKVGAPVRAEDILQARTRLFATGLFRRVDVAPAAEPARPVSDTQIPTRIVATVEEWPVVRFRYGFQVAEERPEDGTRGRDYTPGLSADLTRRTLFGTAISVGVATVLQRRERSGRVFATSPTFLTLPLRTSFVVERVRQQFLGENFTETTGVSWEQRARVWRRLELSYGYRFERVLYVIAGTSTSPGLSTSSSIARLTGTASWDSRNDPAAPVRGSLFTATVEDAPDSLGSGIRFVRSFSQARHFESVRGMVLASAFQYGIVSPRGGQTVIPSELFFTGGATSIRGLPEDSAGPTDVFGPAGGRVLLLFNQEARIPVYRWFQGVAFIDAGNVFRTPKETSFRDLATSIGLGLRVVTPVAMLRLDYGHVVRGLEPGDTRARWTFGIGHVF